MSIDGLKMYSDPVSFVGLPPRTRIFLILLFSIFTLALHASAAEQGAKELRLGYFPNITHAQALYARATGAFDKKVGVPIQWISFNAGPTAIEALFTGAVDATFVGPGPTINGYIKSKGEKFVIVAGSAGGGVGLVVRKDSGITSDRDFGGKVIATPQLGNTQDIAARVWFAAEGYRLRERGGNLSLVPVSNPDQLTMFMKKEIDGAWTVEPWMARLELEGGGVVFLEENTLWPDGKYVTTHLVVSRAYLMKNKQVIRSLIAALVEITERINSDKAAAASILNGQINKETGRALKDEVIQKAMARVEFTWDPISPSLKKSADASYRIGFIKTVPALGGIYALGLLNDVLKEKNLPPVQEPTP
jgi:NitT/TauT family transport system substrate-binding protein